MNTHRVSVILVGLLLTVQGHALASKHGLARVVSFGEDTRGVEAEAESDQGYAPPQAPDDSGWVPTSFDGPSVPVPVAIAAHNCGVVYMAAGAGISLDDPIGGARVSDCATVAPPIINVRTADPNTFDAGDLAAIAFDRARRLASTPQLSMAPDAKGVTGLTSYFWLAEEPTAVRATAEIGTTTVTAEASPVRYDWDFGDGHGTTTYNAGRPWSRRAPGNIGHTYEYRDDYTLTVSVLYAARWSLNGGPWQPLGYFTTSDSVEYPVREILAVLTRSRR